MNKIAEILNVNHIAFLVDANAIVFGVKFMPAEQTCVFDSKTDEPIKVDTLGFLFGPFIMLIVFGGSDDE